MSTNSKASGPSAPQRKNAKSGKVTKAQVQAMESRTMMTPTDVVSRLNAGASSLEASGGAAAAARRRPVAKVFVISREQEYAFIRGDMRRLIIIASSLFVLMIVLLFIFD